MSFQYQRADLAAIEAEKQEKLKQERQSFKFGEHQIRAINYLCTNPKSLLAMGTGVGKSLTVISTFFAMIKKGIIQKGLICCTLASIGEVRNDCMKFYGYEPWEVGTAASLKKWIEMDTCPIALTRYEWLKDVVKDTPKTPIFSIMSMKKVGVAFDEAQRIKNSGLGNLDDASQTFYNSYKLTRAAESIIPMTATPIYSSLDDFWSIMFCTDKNLLGTYNDFVDRYYVTEWAPLSFYKKEYRCKHCGSKMVYRNVDGKGWMICTHPQGCLIGQGPDGQPQRIRYKWRIKHERNFVSYKNMDKLAKRCANSMFCYFPKMDIEFHEASVHLSAETWNRYMAVVNDTIKYKLTDDDIDKADDPTPWSTRALWLQYVIDTSPEKLLALKSLIRQHLHKGVVVYCYYHETIEAVAADLKLSNYEYRVYSGKQNQKERDAIKEWFTKNPENKVLILSPAGGASLNLQATDTFIFYSQPCTFGAYSQAQGRITRLFSKYSKFHIYFVNGYDTIDVYKVAWYISHKDIMHELFNNDIIPENVPDLELSKELRKYLRDKFVWHKEYTKTALPDGEAFNDAVAS